MTTDKVYGIKFDIRQASKALDELETLLGKLEKSKVFDQMKKLNRTMLDLGKSAQKTGKTIKNELGREATKSLNKIEKSGKKASKGIDAVTHSADRAKLSLTDMSRNLNRYVLAPMAALGGLSLKASTDMNKGMASISTLVDQTPEQLRKMRTEARGTMVDFAKGTEDVTQGLYQTISALGESADNMGQLREMTRAAVAGISSTKSSVDLLTAAGKAYNDTSIASIKHTSDLAFQTVKLGVTTFPELAASMGKVLPLAAQFDTSQEELFGTMATLTGVTGNTAEVTTQLASIYTAFMKPSEAMYDGIQKINDENERYNFESASAMVKTLGFKKSIELLGKAAGGSEEELMAMFRRKEAILGILPLISSQSENYTKKIAAMGVASGATDEAFRKQTEGINKQGFGLEKTKQRMVVFAQRLGDRLIPILGRLMDYAGPFLEWLTTVDEESIDTAIAIGKIVGQFVLFVNAMRAFNALGKGFSVIMTTVGGDAALFGSQLGGATGKVKGMTKALAGMQKGIAVLGFLALGYTLGDIFDKGILEPARRADEKKKARQTKEAMDAAIRANKKDDVALYDNKAKLKQQYRDILAEPASVGLDWVERTATTGTGRIRKVGKFADAEVEAERERRLLTTLEGIGSLQEEEGFRETGLQGLRGPRSTDSSTEDIFDPSLVLGAIGSRQSYDRNNAAVISQQFRSVTDAGPIFTGDGGAGGGAKVNMNATFNVGSAESEQRARRIADKGAKFMARELARRTDNVVTR